MSDLAEIREALADYWWAFVLRGIFAIFFGIAALMWPDLTIVMLTVFFGAYCLVDGVVSIVMAISERRGWYVLQGLLSVSAGAVALMWPGVTAVTLIVIMAIWAIAIGLTQVMAAFQLRREIDNEWMLIAGGILSVIFGGIIVARPGVGALAVSWMIGVYALMFGVTFVSLGFRLRKFRPRAMKAGSEEARV